MLQRILRGHLVFTPRLDPFTGEVDDYDFAGPTRFDKLFTGIAVETPPWVPNDGTGEVFHPEDTFDGDYGRLLDRVCVKGVASPTSASWNQLGGWLRAVDGLRRAA